MKMTTEDFRSHRNCYDGYCTKCDEVTREGGTEPDAENYECPECGKHACIGMDYALMGDYLEIEDSDEDSSEDEDEMLDEDEELNEEGDHYEL